MEDLARIDEVVRASAARTATLVAALRRLDADAMLAPSRLPDWSRLTIVCHLRYGARALVRMTSDVLAGRVTSFYPSGRATQRPRTLAPEPGERPGDVVDDLAEAAARLDELWSTLDHDAWAVTVAEPDGNRDLGPIPLARLALARLTEVDVHGFDLDVGLPDWSATLVEVALPTRLAWLTTRRTNHRRFDRSLRGSWLLVAGDFRWTVGVDGDQVHSGPSGPATEPPRATIAGTRRDLLALLLGRPRLQPLRYGGDIDFAMRFEQAFPGP